MATQVDSYVLPEPSTALLSEVLLTKRGGTLTLRYDYDRDGQAYRSGLRFLGVRAHRHRAESHCTDAHVRDAYDALVEVDPSEWVAELRDAARAKGQDGREMHHYMLYLDSAGCFEVVASAWEALPEERGSWDGV